MIFVKLKINRKKYFVCEHNAIEIWRSSGTKVTASTPGSAAQSVPVFLNGLVENTILKNTSGFESQDTKANLYGGKNLAFVFLFLSVFSV
jgi:hypothetical protein